MPIIYESLTTLLQARLDGLFCFAVVVGESEALSGARQDIPATLAVTPGIRHLISRTPSPPGRTGAGAVTGRQSGHHQHSRVKPTSTGLTLKCRVCVAVLLCTVSLLAEIQSFNCQVVLRQSSQYQETGLLSRLEEGRWRQH